MWCSSFITVILYKEALSFSSTMQPAVSEERLCIMVCEELFGRQMTKRERQSAEAEEGEWGKSQDGTVFEISNSALHSAFTLREEKNRTNYRQCRLAQTVIKSTLPSRQSLPPFQFPVVRQSSCTDLRLELVHQRLTGVLNPSLVVVHSRTFPYLIFETLKFNMQEHLWLH